MEKEYINEKELFFVDDNKDDSKNKRTDSKILEKFKSDCQNDILKTVNMINEVLSKNDFSNISVFWKDNLSDKCGSYSFARDILKLYGYIYDNKQFVKENINTEKDIKKFELNKREDNQLIRRSMMIEKNILDRLDVFCRNYPFYSKSYIISELLDRSLSVYE